METRELTSIVFPTEPNVEYVVKDKNGLKQEDVRKASSAMSHEYRFNQLFSTDNSTLPSANGLTITDIYGGHHVAGTTDGQYYHKMYIIDTIRGHWYYFAPNFSNIADVFIGAHIDGTYFSTNHGKVFEGGDKFDIAIQIAKGKTLDFDVQPILVDLTEMFGAGNEPKTDKEVYPYIASGVYYPTMLLGWVTSPATNGNIKNVGQVRDNNGKLEYSTDDGKTWVGIGGGGNVIKSLDTSRITITDHVTTIDLCKYFGDNLLEMVRQKIINTFILTFDNYSCNDNEAPQGYQVIFTLGSSNGSNSEQKVLSIENASLDPNNHRARINYITQVHEMTHDPFDGSGKDGVDYVAWDIVAQSTSDYSKITTIALKSIIILD